MLQSDLTECRSHMIRTKWGAVYKGETECCICGGLITPADYEEVEYSKSKGGRYTFWHQKCAYRERYER